ncbi:MAG: EAL domain-containing protein [Azoarcus sp. PHD]|nr:MAG: EAL domain-containing protein [Azoarcus sp. PHD]
MFAHPSRLAALAFAYTLAGWLALQLAVPPGYAAPFYPAAGIALTGLLIFGYRLWPAIFLGSLLVNLNAQMQSGGPESIGWTLALVPFGAVIQAVFGAWLAQRLIGFPNPLGSPRQILRFLGVVAPASSLISPSLAIPLLYASGTISADDIAFSWWNWWIGDTMGVIIAAPVMFVLFGQPAEDWRSRRLGVIVPLGIAIALLAFAFHNVRNWEALRVQTQFNRDVEHVASGVRKRLEVQIDMMQSIERLMVVSEEVTRAEFHDFVTPWLKRYPGTQNFGWNPLVRHAERMRFEQSVRNTGHRDFRILGRDAEGRTFPAVEAEEYFPITYVEPLAANLSAVGLDPTTLPTTARAIDASRRTGMPVASEAIRLVQEEQVQRGVVVYLATLGKTRGPDQPRPLLGMVSGAFRMDDSMTTARELAKRTGIELCLIDADGSPDNRRLSGAAGCETDAWLHKGVRRALPILFAGRNWELRLSATPEYIAGMRSWAAWSTVAVGLLAIGMLGAFLLITTGNTRRIARLVDRRTEELKTASDSLRAQQDALAEAQRIARLGSWEVGCDGRTLQVSGELHQVLNCDAATLRTLTDLVACVEESDRERLQAAIARATETAGRVTLDCDLGASPGHVLQFQIESTPEADSRHHLRGTVQDVSAEREAEAHIQYLAHFDPLTGLPNRSAWMNQAQTALISAHRNGDLLGILFLDLDNFKTVNDSLGHPVGDRLLAAVARRLAGCLREEDILARLGGDEFVALLPRLPHSDDAAQVARKLIEVLAAPIHIDDHELSTSVSIGIALSPADGEDVDTLLKHADTAMYGAKAAGRNQYEFFVPAMNARAFERLMLENALRRGIERNELVLHYQPQIEARSGQVNGCEALVRWNHPDLGLVPPLQFIPVAEDSGLIGPLGEWVLREACRQQAQWQNSSMSELRMAINISALQFLKPDFVDTVKRALADTGANPQQIELEITESALMQPGAALTGRLLQLRDMGLTLALDDFGTGYSCLAYLKRLPIRRLKIDHSFVRDLPGDQEDAAVTSATLSLARDLGLEVVAEGVETVEQRDYLLARGCHSLQGFMYSRPLTIADFEAWTEARRQPA